MPKRSILNPSFFNRPTLDVAQELLGKFLVRKKGKKIIAAMITDVEAYVGPEDKASHASRGRTKRTEVMFGKPGYWYVYLIYGMHHCLNIVTEKENYPAAILIRAVTYGYLPPLRLQRRPCDPSGVEGVSGPGRVAKYLKIDTRFNAASASKKTGLWIEDREVVVKPRSIKRGKRIGVDYAGEWKDELWRFSII